VIAGLAYPLAMTGVAGADLSISGSGSLMKGWQDHRLGSDRPARLLTTSISMASVATNAARSQGLDQTVDAPFNASNSMGSNLGPTNRALIERVKGDVDKLKGENKLRACSD